MSYAQWPLKAVVVLRAVVLRIGLLGVGVITIIASYGTAGAQTLISGPSPNPDGDDPNDPQAVTACNGAPQIGVVLPRVAAIQLEQLPKQGERSMDLPSIGGLTRACQIP